MASISTSLLLHAGAGRGMHRRHDGGVEADFREPGLSSGRGHNQRTVSLSECIATEGALAVSALALGSLQWGFGADAEGRSEGLRESERVSADMVAARRDGGRTDE